MLEVETRPDGEERVYSKNGLIGATGHEMSRLYPSLSDYQATEAGQVRKTTHEPNASAYIRSRVSNHSFAVR